MSCILQLTKDSLLSLEIISALMGSLLQTVGTDWLTLGKPDVLQ